MYNQPETALENYSINITKLSKARGGILCDTSIGQKLLVPFKGQEKRAQQLAGILSYLQKNGMDVEQLMLTDNNAYISRDNCEATYILKDYRYGRECSPDSWEDMKGAITSLASFHRILVGYAEQPNISLGDMISRKCARIINLKNYIRHKGKKNEFEHLFNTCYEHFLSQGQQAAQCIKEIEKNGIPVIYIHGDFNQHNVVLTQSGRWLPINLETTYQGYPQIDIAEYMRKMLEKNHWNKMLSDCLLESYMEERKMSKDEIRLLSALLLFPEKFCKLCSHYMNSRKSWVCDREVQKLIKLIEQNEERELYLKEAFGILC